MADYRDDDRFTGRLARYARVGTAMGGLAARFAANRVLGAPLDRAQHAGQIRQSLGGLKGPVMKLAQLLSTIPDALPPEYAQELSQLQANAPAMGWPFVRRRMRTELGEDWRARFASFEEQAAAAASLGQVHRATGHDGRLLAVKLQYPDMGSAVEADLKQLDMVLGLYRAYDKSIDVSEIRHELADRLREELDYELEAGRMRLYGHMLAGEAAVHVPEPVADLSTKRLLTMTWLEGRPILDFKQADQETRNRIAINMFRTWYVPFHRYGVIHGDPHLGNYSVREDLTINLLDFGCVRIFPPRFVGGVIDLYRALRDGDQQLAVHAYETWGFKGLTQELIETLNIWASFVYSPLMEDRPRLINAAEKPGDYGREQAAKVHARLRELGPVRPPREFVFMDRAAVGLGGVFLHLQAHVNWYRLFQDIIEGFDVETLARAQGEALQAAGLPPG
ncbi:ABC1 kinase family protein [Pedomonas mirosovicensis]|uniref:ABC1 kinase family protein n=1 Tax=Pedomonas mirosovicensis TaxID=2908641 RepID=UPI00216843EC|nr:AarF/ABC1/UbiB kinase family protein [Pedomonas mirosovicensis]MCH8684726.1 AarF/ABC1/UbiB kinase family protein [Pedomonas mirosovicensis]